MILHTRPELCAIQVTAEAVVTLRQGERHLAILAGCAGVAFVGGTVKRIDFHAFERGVANTFDAHGHGDGDGKKKSI